MRRLRACSDEALLLRVIADDRVAFDALVERYTLMVLRVCRHVLHNREDAEDACQAVWVILWRKAGSIQEKQKLRSWLHGVAHKESLNIQKCKKQHEQHECSCGEISITQFAKFTQPEDDAALREIRILVRTELQCLPDKYRVVLVQCYMEGRSKEEIAEKLRLPVGTVSCHLTRGRETFKRRMAHYGFLATA